MQDHDFGLWGATAEPAPEIGPLQGDQDFDVAIVGAGYTGLSAALHLAGRGRRTVVLEKEDPGFGASGRNGGQVIPGFKTYPDHLLAKYGRERGSAMAAFGAGMADETFALIEANAIRCGVSRNGWVLAGHHPSKLEELRWKHDQWASRGAKVRWLNAAAMAESLGTRDYVGGWIDERGGTVQPLSFARGLARAALAAGALVTSRTDVRSVQRASGGWRIATSHGTVRAGHVVVATNGYTGRLVPRLETSIVSLDSAQIATEPLAPEVLTSILPGASAVSDTRRSLLYFRRSPDGRFVMGGRGGILRATSEANYDRLRRHAVGLFPALQNVKWSHSWAGRLAVTLDHMPHLHETDAGLIASLGCNGRGVAYSTCVGRIIAERITGTRQDELPLPFVPIKSMPMAPFRKLGAALVARWYGWRDGDA